MLIILCCATPNFNSKNQREESARERSQQIENMQNRVNNDLMAIRRANSIDIPSLEEPEKIEENFDMNDLEHSFIFKNLDYDKCPIEDNSEVLIVFFYFSLILFFFLSIHGFFLNIMTLLTRNSFKDLLLWSDNFIFFGSLIFLSIFLILFIFLIIKYKLYSICSNDCNNFLLDYKALDLKQKILEIISLYDEKSRLYIIRRFFKNQNISSILAKIEKIEKIEKNSKKTKNSEIKDRKSLINQKIHDLLKVYNEKDFPIYNLPDKEDNLPIYDFTEKDVQIRANKSNSIILFFRNHLYSTIILMVLCPLAIAFSFANENLKILNPILCTTVFLIFILYFIYFLFFIIKVRKQDIAQYPIFFKRLELIKNESRLFGHKFSKNITESIDLSPN